jgi:nitrite reductase/ring-hydroxylating ferredoxin subunit
MVDDSMDDGLITAEQALCAGDQLIERDKAVVFDVRLGRAPARAFALRFDGRVVCYINRCAHVPTEMDWQEGQFLDMDKRWILCSIHGAAYEPADGRCVGGPCGNGRLIHITTTERNGTVYWYPSRDIQPVVFDDAGPAPADAP